MKEVVSSEREMFSSGLIFSTSALTSTRNWFISSAEPPSLCGVWHTWSDGWTECETESDWAGVSGRKVICSVTTAHDPMSQITLWQPRRWSDKGPATPMSSPLVPDKIEDELEMTMVCHRPEGLEQLEAQTNFTKRELQVLYRGFKNVRPAGLWWPRRDFPLGTKLSHGTHQGAFPYV